MNKKGVKRIGLILIILVAIVVLIVLFLRLNIKNEFNSKGEIKEGSVLSCCKNLGGSECLSLAEKAITSISVCESLSQQINKDCCFLSLPTSGSEICKEIINQSLQGECYLNYAYSGQDDYLCQKIQIESQRDNCYFSTSNCERIVNLDTKNRCIEAKENPMGIDLSALLNKRTPLNSESMAQRYPKIDDFRIVWQDKKDKTANWNIVLYNLYTNKTKQLNSVSVESNCPDIEGNRVVWADFRTIGAVYAYDLSEDREYKVSQETNRTIGCPKISEGIIAWEYQPLSVTLDPSGPNYSNEFGIAYYDIEKEKETLVLNQKTPITQISLFNRTIIFLNSTGLFSFNINSGVISGLSGPKYEAVISDSNIVWLEGTDVYIYNYKTQETERITNAPSVAKSELSISSDFVVWSQNDDVSQPQVVNLYSYNINTHQISQITNFTIQDMKQARSSNIDIAWMVYEQRESEPNIPGRSIIRSYIRHL